ncbi:MAG: cytochrome c [Leptolyngbya sp. SIO1D8]|nr:cytochrome c [Leptolyngbya sp. SIO1D8]
MRHNAANASKPFIAISKRKFLMIIGILIAIVLWLVWPLITNNGPVYYADEEEHFRYGSIGGEDSDGFPYWIVKVLPTVFADKLPGEGFTSFGFIQEPDREFPIGFARSTNKFGLDVVTQNCATCHVGLLRGSADEKTPEIISAMPGMTVNLQAYIQFLAAAGLDERFNADHLMPYINEVANLNLLEKLLYRFIVIPQTRNELIHQGHDFSFMERQPPYGPGRVDTFTSYKTRRYGFPVEQLAPVELKGISDYPSIWHQRPRQNLRLHWDGNNNDGSERNRTAALALVAPTTINFDAMERVRAWLMDLQPPKYPYEIDPSLAAKGKAIYANSCASCHAPKNQGGYKLGSITPIEELKTDRGRLDSYTYELASNQNLTFAGISYKGVDQRFSHFKKTNGYANTLLDGLWLRSPYLHNGSVPTLWDLLNKPEERPTFFYRGYDVFDRKNVGYVSTVPEENGKKFFPYDTTEPGNSKTGHLYGTELSDESKEALLEYLKTL